MPLLFKDYTDLVLKAYEEKRDSNSLPQLLMHPTTANIKKECINVYTERLERGEKIEENTLRAFFGILPEGGNFGNLIEWHRLGKFKSIQKLIRKEVQNPSSANVELLAWLIDFVPRPLSQAQIVFKKTNGTNNSPISSMVDDNEGKPELNGAEIDPAEIKEILPGEKIKSPENPPHDGVDKMLIKDKEYTGTASKKKSQNRRLKIAATTSLVLATLLGGVYMTEKNYRSTTTGCMYWAEDHYEQVPCNEEGKSRLILALDEEKMKNFRKITREDTITEWSIGKIYYLKDNRVLEYYTEGGNHPVDVTRTLKVLSRHMFDTYLRKKEVSGKDSLVESNKKS